MHTFGTCRHQRRYSITLWSVDACSPAQLGHHNLIEGHWTLWGGRYRASRLEWARDNREPRGDRMVEGGWTQQLQKKSLNILESVQPDQRGSVPLFCCHHSACSTVARTYKWACHGACWLANSIPLISNHEDSYAACGRRFTCLWLHLLQHSYYCLRIGFILVVVS